ncbi:hypothetical protein PDJAM_G00129330 [Pangasius djambal]|uniref:Uncharacterized protein n=1 Tax=Pangasius djambal TaxID=1691987 RepID=A0ACC5ZB50_9TELE|nr:hypothetical protein [Pangasius djambal]
MLLKNRVSMRERTEENVKILFFCRGCEEPYVQIITVRKGQRSQSVCSSPSGSTSEDEDAEDTLPVLQQDSHILREHHIEKVFGAFSSDSFRVSDCCYGTGETFLYTFSPEFKMFRWSGENSYFVRGFLDSLQLGAGGGPFGLWLDSDLLRGATFSCNTFRNAPLSPHHDFSVRALEVWSFQ